VPDGSTGPRTHFALTAVPTKDCRDSRPASAGPRRSRNYLGCVPDAASAPLGGGPSRKIFAGGREYHRGSFSTPKFPPWLLSLRRTFKAPRRELTIENVVGTDPTYTDGGPGMGFFIQGSVDPTQFGFASFKASSHRTYPLVCRLPFGPLSRRRQASTTH
jgi:hypothetical protein